MRINKIKGLRVHSSYNWRYYTIVRLFANSGRLFFKEKSSLFLVDRSTHPSSFFVVVVF